MKTTPENITTLEPHQIFVFGSNYAGRHGKGAANIAAAKFGARYGQAVGLMGQSYGIATKDRYLKTLSLDKISVQIAKFLKYAAAHPENEFFVTQIGCGLAGYSPKQIAPLFEEELPPNVVLPASFLTVLNFKKMIQNK